MKIEVVQDVNIFKELKEPWDDLLDKSESSSVFLTWEWLYYWWLHFAEGKELFILLLKDETSDQLLGIAPFCLEKVRLFYLFPVKKIKFLGTDAVASDFLDCILTPGRETEAMQCICKYLFDNSQKWDVVELGDIEENSSTISLLKQNIGSNYKLFECKAQACPYIKLPNDYEVFLKSLSSKMRTVLRWRTNQLEKKYQLEFLIDREEGQVKENIDKLLKLHNSRFKAKRGETASSCFSGSKMRDFHYDIATNFLPKQRVKFYFFNDEKEAVACLYTFEYKNKLFFYQTGFNPEWHKRGLGTVLLGYAIRDSIERGLSEFHYLRGGEDYKSRWTKTIKRTQTLLLANNSFQGALYYGLTDGKFRLKEIAKKYLRRGTKESA
ncbi:GNAT family N-acetyltransferase [Candidatus Electronema sp. PJ]|uniref:GNAT family N-acetyltransferase n=1 Tax=Candidatus Electronema sp. PJ TaxID=3401572 RepID=UPI003AA85758